MARTNRSRSLARRRQQNPSTMAWVGIGAAVLAAVGVTTWVFWPEDDEAEEEAEDLGFAPPRPRDRFRKFGFLRGRR